MGNFKDIERNLETILATTYDILGVNEPEGQKVEAIDELLTKRDRQLQKLYRCNIEKRDLSSEQKEKLRNFFTRFYLSERKMSRFLGKLSLNYQELFEKIEHHDMVERTYTSSFTSTSKFLDARITE